MLKTWSGEFQRKEYNVEQIDIHALYKEHLNNMTLVANQVIHKHTKSIVISHKCVKTSSTAPISFISEKFPYHDKCLKLEELERCYLSIHGTTLLLTPDDAL